MKTLFHFILILYCINSCAQTSGLVEYQYIKSLGVDYETIGILEFNNSRSKFIELNPNDLASIEVKNENEIISKQFSKTRPKIFIDTKLNYLLSEKSLFNKTYLIKESIPKIKWEIVGETKKIKKFNCQKARGYFRGRVYTAWFTNDVPISYGPWKLQGLPGLILEAHDSKNEIVFLAKKIILNTTNKINIPNGKNAISLETFISLKPKIYKEREDFIRTKLSRSGSFSLPLPPRSSQKEIIYEWEEDN